MNENRLNAALANAQHKTNGHRRINVAIIGDDIKTLIVTRKSNGASVQMLAWTPVTHRVTVFDVALDEGVACDVFDVLAGTGLAGRFLEDMGKCSNAPAIAFEQTMLRFRYYSEVERVIQVRAL